MRESERNTGRAPAQSGEHEGHAPRHGAWGAKSGIGARWAAGQRRWWKKKKKFLSKGLSFRLEGTQEGAAHRP
jgi:hypothetical protein